MFFQLFHIIIMMNIKKKFVELIIEESARILLAWKDEPFPFDENLAVQLIREHFGLKA